MEPGEWGLVPGAWVNGMTKKPSTIKISLEEEMIKKIQNSGIASVLTQNSEKQLIFDFLVILGFFQVQENLSFTMQKNAHKKVVITNTSEPVTQASIQF